MTTVMTDARRIETLEFALREMVRKGWLIEGKNGRYSVSPDQIDWLAANANLETLHALAVINDDIDAFTTDVIKLFLKRLTDDMREKMVV